MPRNDVYVSDIQEKFLDNFEQTAESIGYNHKTVKSISNCLCRMGIESPDDYISNFDDILRRYKCTTQDYKGVHEEIVRAMLAKFEHENSQELHAI